MKRGVVCLAFSVILLSGCGSGELEAELQSQKTVTEELRTENELLKDELDKIKAELDEQKNGPGRLLAEARQFFVEKNIESLNETLAELKDKHPTATEVQTVSELSTQLAESIKAAEEEAAKKAAEEEAAKKKRLSEATKKMRINYDEVSEVTWYKDKTSPKYVDENAFYIYVAELDDVPRLMLRIQYSGEDWVFIDHYNIKIDDTSYKIDSSNGKIMRDTNNGFVVEYYNGLVARYEYDMIKSIIESEKTIVRGQGDQHRHDHTITAAEKTALQNVLDAYESLGGTEPPTELIP